MKPFELEIMATTDDTFTAANVDACACACGIFSGSGAG
jgi:hypothetical protein